MAVQFIESHWLGHMKEATRATRNQVRLMSPFVQRQAMRDVLGSSKAKIRLITRYNVADFRSKVSDIGVLDDLMALGADIRGVSGLHAKVYIFDSDQAIVTSANLTGRALRTNREFGVLGTEDFVDPVSAYFEQLWHDGEPLTKRLLSRMHADLDKASKASTEPEDDLPDYGASPSLDGIETSTQGFVKFFGSGNNRANRSMPIAEEIRRSGCHWACTYPRNKRPRRVETGAVIYFGRLVHTDNDILIYGRGVGHKYVIGRDDASRTEIKLRPWKQKWPHYVRVNDPVFVSGTLEQGVSLNDLMDELGADCFASTQRNHMAGDGNTDPRRAYRQQAAVELTVQGQAVLRARLNAALARYGKITSADLSHLDWPTQTLGRAL